LGSLLNHPNLVPLVDTGPDSGTPWLAMEYVDGQRMDEYLRLHGPLPVPEVIRIARASAAAMAHAHAHGVVHRDLKPGNVMLLEGEVKVMDFGIARTLDSETLTTTYAFLGTPLYAAPEVQFKTQVGAAADCYSLGIMLFEMLAGRAPFRGETPFEILDQHRSAPLPDLRALRPDVPEGLVAAIERLCAKKPEERLEEVALVEILDGLI
jgi:serine/threonine-protein kinase